MSTNLIPLVKAALEEQLTTVLDPVPVSWGTERGKGMGGEWVVIGDVDGPQSAVVLSRRADGYRREQLPTVLVQVFKSGRDIDTPRSLTERAFELVDLLETHLRTNPTLGIGDGQPVPPYVIDAQVVRTDLRESTDGDQRTSRVDVYVQVKGRS